MLEITSPIDKLKTRLVFKRIDYIQEHLEAMQRDPHGLEYAPWKEEVYMIVLPGGDCRVGAEGHWINDTVIANPMSRYPHFQESRAKWGMDAIKGIFIEVFTETGERGFATAYGGYLASWIIKNHFNRFLIVSLVYSS